MGKPDDITETAWVSLLRAHRKALGRVERALKAASLPPLEWYDVLLELERAEGDGLRPRELEARLLLAQSNLSRLLDRMEAAGLVRRTPCADDGRGRLVVVTREGRSVRKRAWPVYREAIGEAIGRRLDGEEAGRLSGLLEKLLR